MSRRPRGFNRLAPLFPSTTLFRSVQLPLILKMNSSNAPARGGEAPDQAVTASVDDALRLGWSAIGFTIYPASDMAFDQMEELRELILEAKSVGLAAVVWSYMRGGSLKIAGAHA